MIVFLRLFLKLRFAAADEATTRCSGPAWLGLAELGSIILPPLATALAPARASALEVSPPPEASS